MHMYHDLSRKANGDMVTLHVLSLSIIILHSHMHQYSHVTEARQEKYKALFFKVDAKNGLFLQSFMTFLQTI